MDKYLHVKDLLKLMGKKGLPKSRMWIRHQEKVGNLICPRLPNRRGDRVFTFSQAKEIIVAFSPGGEGRWNYGKD